MYVLYAILAMLSFGISPIFYKTILRKDIPPFVANQIRAIMVLPMMLIFFIFSLKNLFQVTSNVLIILAIIAFLGPVMGDSMYFYSLKYIDVSLTAPLSSLYAVLIPILMFIFLGTSFNIFIILGAIFVVFGIYLLQERKMSKFHKRGVVFALVSAIFYSLAILLMGIAISIASAEVITIYRIIFSILFLTPLALRNNYIPKNPLIWIILGIGGFFGIGIGIVFMLYSINIVGVAITGIFSSASPLITSILGIAIFKEEKNLKKIVGIGIIGIGLLISNF
ncbi:MAG: DMT family transporter [Thermoplasmata archaeon]